MSGESRPYISLVVAARNDNHGVNMLGRMQAFLDSWMLQADRYSVPSEIVVVEWNPPAGRRLREDLQWPSRPGACGVRFVEVSPEMHADIPNAGAIPLHQMIAKNVGIRRARGEYVLATNLDIIFSGELMRFFAARRLEPNAFYRLDRLDVSSEIPQQRTLDELLEFCNHNVLRVCAREGVWDTRGGADLRPVEQADILSPDSGIRLGAGWFGIETPEGVPHRYLEQGAEVLFERPRAGTRLVFDIEAGPGCRDGWAELVIQDGEGVERAAEIVDGRCQLRLLIPGDPPSGRLRLAMRNCGIPLLEDPRLLDLRAFGIHWMDDASPSHPAWKLERIGRRPGADWAARGLTQSPYANNMRNAVYLHTNGCGDFTMMSRDNWFSLRAYPEFPVWPQHIDSLLCYSAHHAGIHEVILRDPMRIFHIQHGSASGATPDGEAELKARVRARGVTFIDYKTLLGYFHHMRRFDAPLIFSGRHWGLGDQELIETSPFPPSA